MSRYTLKASARRIFIVLIIAQISIPIEIQDSSGLIVGNINYIQDVQSKGNLWHDVREAVKHSFGLPNYIQVTQPGTSPVILDISVSNSRQNLHIQIDKPIIVANELSELSRPGKKKLIQS
ncbi:hypothetical protein DdX_18062 [Ditylenchus destructor]|uniref:Uncharacterized protein n=1 Tax=Ditylenchus destructor TaxID=166010 RepID=A0AAD4QV86_9BILA|nr:hypothetical protein DdX_18062 [Ditylenchus destructor]